MADPTYEQLTTPATREEILDELLGVMASPDFNLPTESWGAFDEPLATLAADAQIHEDLSAKVAGIAKAGVTEDASGDILDIHAADAFDETRELGVPTLGTVTFTETEGSPKSWAAGDLLFTSRLNSALVYVNTGAVSLSALGTASVALSAQEIGAAYNIQGSDLQLSTPVPGVTMTAASGTSWITQSGTDDESDEKLRLRCQTKWATLTTTGPIEAYKKWALDASASINRVFIQEDPGAIYPLAPVKVFVAGPTGAVGSSVIAALTAYIEARRPLGILVTYASASNVTFDLTGTVRVKASKRAAAEAAINALLDAWWSGETVSVNGEDLEGLQLAAVIRISQIIELVQSVSGVIAFTPKKVDGTTIYVPETDDVTLSGNQVSVLARALTYVEVT